MLAISKGDAHGRLDLDHVAMDTISKGNNVMIVEQPVVCAWEIVE